jgi:hypothetical protein
MKATQLRRERGVLRDNRQAEEVPSRCFWSRTRVRFPRLTLCQSASGGPFDIRPQWRDGEPWGPIGLP